VADDVESAQKFVQANGWTWPSIHDPGRERARRLGADYQPHVIVLDHDGSVIASFGGGGTPADWQALVERAESAAP
jgi:hypothetical protein